MEERPKWGVLGLKGLGEKPGRVFSPPEGYPPLNLARRGARPRNRSRATGPEAQGQNKMNQACLGALKSASWTTRGLGKYTFYQTRVFRALQGGPQNIYLFPLSQALGITPLGPKVVASEVSSKGVQ